MKHLLNSLVACYLSNELSGNFNAIKTPLNMKTTFKTVIGFGIIYLGSSFLMT